MNKDKYEKLFTDLQDVQRLLGDAETYSTDRPLWDAVSGLTVLVENLLNEMIDE